MTFMQRFLVIICLCSVYTTTTIMASKLVGEIVDFFEKILSHHDKQIFDIEAYKIIAKYFDDDAYCSTECEEHLHTMIGDGIPFTELHVLVDKIYGDQISDDPYEPQEVHLALTNDITSMKVMFVTMKNLDNPFVQYKTFLEKDWKVAQIAYASNYTYEVTQKWWPVFTGVIYEVDMVGLKPDLSYTYRVGGYDSVNQTIRYSKDFTFRAAPEGNPNRKTVVTTMADHGTFMLFGFLTVDKIVSKLNEINMDFMFVAGDLSYAGLSSSFKPLNITSEDEFEHIWDLAFIQNEPIASQYPWMVGDGNHERFYNWTAFTNRYKMPQNEKINSVGNFWYDFNYGNIHWISISSEHSLQDGSPQKIFLEASLENAVAMREVVPWIIVTLHKPLYCSADGTPGGYADALEEILIKYDVDLTITGHMHLYERIHPVLNGQVTVYPERKFLEDVYYSTGKGPVHVVQGNTGAMQWETWIQPQPQWSAKRFANGFIPLNRTTTEDEEIYIKHVEGPILPSNYTNTFGFGVLTTWNSTHLHYEAMADTDSMVGTDSFWIIKRL